MNRKLAFGTLAHDTLGIIPLNGWCSNYTPYEREKFSPETCWLHHVCAFAHVCIRAGPVWLTSCQTVILEKVIVKIWGSHTGVTERLRLLGSYAMSAYDATHAAVLDLVVEDILSIMCHLISSFLFHCNIQNSACFNLLAALLVISWLWSLQHTSNYTIFQSHVSTPGFFHIPVIGLPTSPASHKLVIPYQYISFIYPTLALVLWLLDAWRWRHYVLSKHW